MSRRAATAWTAGGAAVVAMVLSVGRILLSNSSALDELVWAEDGMFPLCVKGHGFWDCLTDPFAGYFLFLPRVIAWPISLVPIDTWPLATNLAAALVAGMAAALAVVILRAAGTGIVASAFVAVLPVLVPIAGLEAINASGSGYMLLAFVGALACSFPPVRRFPTAAYTVGLLVVSLTIPSSVVLLLPLAVQVIRRRIPVVGGLVAAGGLVVGLVVQLVVALTAADPRRVSVSLDSLRSWADGVPAALVSLLPGQSGINDDGTLATGVGIAAIGLVIVAIMLAVGIALTLRPEPVANGVGLLVLVGLAFGAIPALSGYANNRYFVVPIVVWLAAGVIALDRLVPARRELAVGVAVVILVAFWIPGLPASHSRATAAPLWSQTIGEARTSCANDPNATVAIVFSPAWPFADAVWLGPTSNAITCRSLGFSQPAG